MIRKLLATTAIATLMTSGAAFAQTTAPTMDAAPAAPMVKQAEGHLASNIIGKSVFNGTGEDAENIGKVNDLVLDAEGNIQAIVVGVGGFLGMGQKNVALEYGLVEWTDMDGEEYMVVQTNREALEALAEFDTAAFQPQPADAETGNTQPATADDLAAAPAAVDTADDSAADDMSAAPTDSAPADDTASAPADDAAPADDMAAAPADDVAPADDTTAAPADDTAPADDMAAAPTDEAAPADESAPSDGMAAAPTGTDDTETSAIDRSTLNEVTTTDISADDFVGTTVYGANDENVGDIGDVVLSDDGNVEAVIIDVGGFLGVGEKPVAVGMDNLAFLSDEDGDMYLYTQFTKEQLEAQPEYDEATFAEARDEQLLISPAQ